MTPFDQYSEANPWVTRRRRRDWLTPAWTSVVLGSQS